MNYEGYLPLKSLTYLMKLLEKIDRELKKITRQHRALRTLASLPLLAPEASIAEDAANVVVPQITWSQARKSLLTGDNPAQPAEPQVFFLEFSTQAEQEQAATKQPAQQDEQVETIVRNVENVEETEVEHQAPEKEHLGSVDGQQVLEQPAPEEEDQPQNSPSYGSSARFSIHNEDSKDNFGPYPSANPSLKEMQNIVASLDSKVQSMVGSLDSKVDELFNIQTFMKHDFGIYKRVFYEKMDTMAANIASSQKSLETSLVRQFTEHQL
ncbi:hypothetical protein F511_20390 [Dorcoceras hygrometricum]|uniref:Uncharacterized protein n=1 Tax=Dorcoceras hygrometricum TaxID=472368 RepID=A0A2Z7AU85_9LAMI|nr:hypothetical protein F511_20390 [Dorcoceras hygrometricum]